VSVRRYIAGENLVSEQTNEAEEATETAPTPTPPAAAVCDSSQCDGVLYADNGHARRRHVQFTANSCCDIAHYVVRMYNSPSVTGLSPRQLVQRFISVELVEVFTASTPSLSASRRALNRLETHKTIILVSRPQSTSDEISVDNTVSKSAKQYLTIDVMYEI